MKAPVQTDELRMRCNALDPRNDIGIADFCINHTARHDQHINWRVIGEIMFWKDREFGARLHWRGGRGDGEDIKRRRTVGRFT
jgi:hypothetical protein